MIPAVLDPTPDQARSWLVEELAKAEYQDSASFVERFFRWLGELFNRQPTGSADGVNAPPIVLIAIGLALIVALVFLLLRIRADREVVKAPREAVLGELDLSRADYLARADAALRAQQWGAAVLDYTRAFARDAADRDLLHDAPSLTAHEIGVRLGPVFPMLADDISSGMDRFDTVRYSRYAATAADAQAARDLAARAHTARPVTDLTSAGGGGDP